MVNLHPGAEEAIRRRLEAAVDSCKIEKGYPATTDNDVFDENVIAASVEMQKHVAEWMNKSDVRHLLLRSIQDMIYQLEPDYSLLDLLNGFVRDVVGQERATSLVDDAIKVIKSLPRLYAFDFPLPNLRVTEGFESISITPSASIVYVAGNEYPLSEKSFYLRVESRGYASDRPTSVANQKAIGTMKRFCYLSALFGDFRQPIRKSTSSYRGLYARFRTYHINDITDETGRSDKADLPSAVQHVLEQVGLSKFRAELLPEANALAQNRPATLGIEPAKEGETAMANLQAAVEWAFDGQSADDDRVALIQTCVALEALLGEELGNDEPLTSTLADRCAYLLGRTAGQRTELRRSFKELYKIRSKLVHGRVTQLSEEEEEYLMRGQLILKRGLQRELQDLATVCLT